MVVPRDFTLPQDEEVTVQEINLTYPNLHGASYYVGKECENVNNEFMLCKKETEDPRQCIQEGKLVTACAMKVFQGIKAHCEQEFRQYVKCLQWSSGKLEFKFCRKTQAALDECVLKNLNIERPPFGYFCQSRVHETKRPQPPTPESYLYPKTYPDASPVVKRPKDDPSEPAQFPRHILV